MNDGFFNCCMVLIMMVVFTSGFLCFYYGASCEDAKQRAKNNDLCKNIHNDVSAKVLQVFGWIFSILFFVGNCFCWAIVKDRGTSVRPTPTVRENGGGSAFVIMVYR